MKKTLLLSVVCFLFALQSASAYNATTKLQLRAYNNSLIMVTVDGTTYGAYTNSQNIDNLQPGTHQLQVFAVTTNPRNGQTHRQSIYTGSITLPQGHMVDAVVNPGNDLQIVTDVAMYQPTLPTRIADMRHSNANTTTNYPDATCQIQPVAMCDAEFKELICSISSKSFESSKIQIIKQALSYNYVTSYQVRDLMESMTFETSKMDIAKFAYNRTIDPNHYYVVNDAFTFESSISALDMYLQNCHQGIAYK